MGIRNIDQLGDTPATNLEQPTEPPKPSNTQAGNPTPIDNIAREEPSESGQAPEQSGSNDGGE